MPDALEFYTVVFLRHEDRYLLLKRAMSKEYAPGKWTGVGGRIEHSELDDIAGSALREVKEETGRAASDIHDFELRRVLLFHLTDGPHRLVYYYSGNLDGADVVDSAEGTLHWLTRGEVDAVDLVDSTRRVFPLLFGTQDGGSSIVTGVARYDTDGEFLALTWL